MCCCFVSFSGGGDAGGGGGGDGGSTGEEGGGESGICSSSSKPRVDCSDGFIVVGVVWMEACVTVLTCLGVFARSVLAGMGLVELTATVRVCGEGDGMVWLCAFFCFGARGGKTFLISIGNVGDND